MTQEQYSQMNNLILNLTTQLTSKPAAKPEPDLVKQHQRGTALRKWILL
jgi:hypothetical protein